MMGDYDNAGEYPIILSDALLGKPSKEVYTSIRYNYKPEIVSSTSTSDLHLQPSEVDVAGYNLSFTENEEQFDYNGTRSTEEGQYVLVFDSEKKHFVLHRLDSNFDMNLISAPWTEEASILRDQYPQLETKSKPQSTPSARGSPKTKASVGLKPAKRHSLEKTKNTKYLAKEPTLELEDEDSDDGLQIEYPGGPPPARKPTIFSTPLIQRAPSEEFNEDHSDVESQVHQDENLDVNLLKPPSPNNNANEMSDEDIEADLEAELEQALQAENQSLESDESEEE